MLLPFVRLVIACLLCLTIGSAAAGVARIHMIILSVLSGGLLLSLQFFESEYKKLSRRSRGTNDNEQSNNNNGASAAASNNNKTD